jgi:hypothetical protein
MPDANEIGLTALSLQQFYTFLHSYNSLAALLEKLDAGEQHGHLHTLILRQLADADVLLLGLLHTSELGDAQHRKLGHNTHPLHADNLPPTSGSPEDPIRSLLSRVQRLGGSEQ